MFTQYAPHTLTPEQVAKVPAGPHTMLTAEQAVMAVSIHPVADRPRVYGYLIPAEGEPNGGLVKLHSLATLNSWAGRLAFAWASGTTVADMIGRA